MNNRDDLTLGEIIKRDMLERGIKATVVAKKMNVSRQSINKIDKRKKFDLDYLKEFKKASGLDYTQYAAENTLSRLREQETPSSTSNRVTLTLNVSCNKNRLADFSLFLNQIETIADEFEYHFI